MNNPLLAQSPLPPFKQIKPKHIFPALEALITENRKGLAKLLRQKRFTWDNLMVPLEEMGDRLQNMWGPVEHLNAVMNSPKIRKIYNQCLPLLIQYEIETSQNKKLFTAISSLANSAAFKKLKPQQKRVIKNELRDFKLSGIDLTGKAKKRFAELQEITTKLSTKFEENVLDTTNAWQHTVKSKAKLAGVPEFIIQMAKQKAKAKKERGWLLGLDFPTYLSVMQYADNQALRKTFYEAFSTRASDQGPHHKKWDNSQVMVDLTPFWTSPPGEGIQRLA